MSIPSIEDLLNAEVAEFSNDIVPEGEYDAVITDVEVRKGAKGPYLGIKATIFNGEQARRPVWRNSSFSEKAVNMPGGIANLVQSAKPDIPKDTPANEVPAAIAQAVISCPVVIEVEHEQVVRNGVPQVKADGQPELRAQIRSFSEPSDELIAAFEAEASGTDDDLPF